MELRYYQRSAVNSVWRFIADPEKKSLNPCVVIPTGGGKTPVIATLCSDLVRKWHRRVLVVSHVKELLAQSVEKLKIVDPTLEKSIGMYSAGFDRRDTAQPIIVAGIQSIYNRAELFGARDLVIVDEAHLIPPDGSGMYQTLFAGLREASPEMRICGLTATPYRTGSGAICTPDGMLNEICYEVGVQELIHGKYLCKLRSKGGRKEVDTTGLKIQGGEFAALDVDFLMNSEDLVSSISGEIVELTKERHTVLIFASSVSHGRNLCNCIRGLGGVCDFVCGDTPSDERELILRRFKGESVKSLFGGNDEPLKFLVNVNVLTTGFDAPNIDCVAIVRPTMSPGLYYQMVGRGLRPHASKENCLVLDFGGNVLRHGPIDSIEPKKKGRRGDIVPVKKCPECDEYVSLSAQACNVCGYLFYHEKIEPDLTYSEKLTAKASNESVLSGEVTDTELRVKRVYYSDHEKKGNPNAPHTLEVEYDCGVGGTVKEWVCLEHCGFVGEKAKRWWRKRSKIDVPESAAEAAFYANNGGLAEPTEITVRHISGQKFDRVIHYVLGEKPDWVEKEPEYDEWDSGPDDWKRPDPSDSDVETNGIGDHFNTEEDEQIVWGELPDDVEIPF